MTDRSRLWRGALADGTEVLITAWPAADGTEVLELALRHADERMWGPPARLTEEPT